MASITYFSGIFRTIPSIDPNTFDANPGATKGPLVHIAITS
jgi:hypothetical protein